MSPEGGFDVLIACAFNYEAHTTEFESLGKVPVLKARMNADLPHGRRPEEHGKAPLRIFRRAGCYSGQWSVASD